MKNKNLGLYLWSLVIMCSACSPPRVYMTYIPSEYDVFGVDLDRSEYGVNISMYPPKESWRELGWVKIKHVAEATYMLNEDFESHPDEFYRAPELATFDIIDGEWRLALAKQQAMVDSIARTAALMGGDRVADLKVTFDFVAVSRGVRGRFLSNPIELPVIIIEGVVCTSGDMPR